MYVECVLSVARPHVEPTPPNQGQGRCRPACILPPVLGNNDNQHGYRADAALRTLVSYFVHPPLHTLSAQVTDYSKVFANPGGIRSCRGLLSHMPHVPLAEKFTTTRNANNRQAGPRTSRTKKTGNRDHQTLDKHSHCILMGCWLGGLKTDGRKPHRISTTTFNRQRSRTTHANQSQLHQGRRLVQVLGPWSGPHGAKMLLAFFRFNWAVPHQGLIVVLS